MVGKRLERFLDGYAQTRFYGKSGDATSDLEAGGVRLQAPYSEREAAIDSLFVDFVKKQVRLYQMTINHRHGILTSAVKGWLNYFESFGFTVLGIYFVTDAQAYPGFKKQKWKTLKKDGYSETLNQTDPLLQFAVMYNFQFSNGLAWSNAKPEPRYVEQVTRLNSSEGMVTEPDYVPAFTGQDWKRRRGSPTFPMDTSKVELLCVLNEEASI